MKQIMNKKNKDKNNKDKYRNILNEILRIITLYIEYMLLFGNFFLFSIFSYGIIDNYEDTSFRYFLILLLIIGLFNILYIYEIIILKIYNKK